jgi:glutamate synthase (NADPH) large chain
MDEAIADSPVQSPGGERDACGVGLIARLQGPPDRCLVDDALTALRRMNHRAGHHRGTGDGSGILLGLPHRYLRGVLAEALGVAVPEPGRYGVGMIFLPRDPEALVACRNALEEAVREKGHHLLGWRQVPVNRDVPGEAARAVEPTVEQMVVAASREMGVEAFERELFLIRRVATRKLRQLGVVDTEFHVCSLSARTIVYKGQLTPDQLPRYYPDLQAPSLASNLALVHTRFSTNTMPSWRRSQPFRVLGHNGEINTLQGNVNWMRSREPLLASDTLGEDLQTLIPITDSTTSDSGILDNVLELLVRAGRSLPEALLAMVPQAWENDPEITPETRSFFEAHSMLMEPWDGPASVLFTDGRFAGGLLDRNGLRPSRFWITRDHRVILASEVGVVDVAAEDVVRKGRLQPGRIFLLDLDAGRIIEDDEVKAEVASRRPWGEWLASERVRLEEVVAEATAEGTAAPGREAGTNGDVPARPRDRTPAGDRSRHRDRTRHIARMRAFGYTRGQMDFLLEPMVRLGKDPVGSMGNDAALACLSHRARLPYDYLKQRFAQVTNPPIDSIRERVVMSLACAVGPQENLLEPGPANLHRLVLPSPILREDELSALTRMEGRGWRTRTLELTAAVAEGPEFISTALERICGEAEEAVAGGVAFLILSDRRADRSRIPVSALLAVGAVHHHLIRVRLRARVALILDTGEPREVHHLCALLGYGADGIHPWLAMDAIRSHVEDRSAEAATSHDVDSLPDPEAAVEAWIEAAEAGILKVLAKMGISTLSSYKGAQIFEALGLGHDVIRQCFRGTVSRVGGVGFEVLGQEALIRQREAYPGRGAPAPTLDVEGEFAWRPDGEARQWNPGSIAALQHAARGNSREAYREYSRLCREEEGARATLRSLLELAPSSHPAIPLDEVEPAAEIVKRFATGAMSFGALSREAHETLAVAMNRIGGRSNSGEGGEDPERATPLPNGDSRRSAIRQIASGRFGVSSEYLAHADQIQIKMAQGAKPGEGGELPGRKVSAEIARVRGTTPGVMLISPPPHHDIYSIEDLAQLIFDLRNASPQAEICVKLVSEAGVGTVAAGVAKAGADRILISGHDGGTGASPLTSVRHAGLPWELGLSEAREVLRENGLRDEVLLETDGLLRTGWDVVVACLLGADSFGFATAPLITMGCIMMRKCHMNTCPVGICTQDPVLRERFAGAPEHVLNYLFLVAEEAREYLAHMGFRTMEEAVGRADRLRMAEDARPWKALEVDLDPLLQVAPGSRAPVQERGAARARGEAERRAVLDHVLDRRILRRAESALEGARPIRIQLPVRNEDRAVGTLLSHQVTRRFGERGLPDGTIHVKLNGSAGQSLGAWLSEGVTLELEGDTNDYVGKGLSGGRIILYPPRSSPFVPEETILAGNVVLYGAIRGQVFIRGQAGERFCVRNSGAEAVVEGVGDHGCEYMTGGRAVILGPTGRNFAAGMSGGIAYVWDPEGALPSRCNTELVELSPVAAEEDREELRRLLERHRRFTGSTVAQGILEDWEEAVGAFVKVIPTQYREALEAHAAGLDDAAGALVEGGAFTGSSVALPPGTNGGPRGSRSRALPVLGAAAMETTELDHRETEGTDA